MRKIHIEASDRMLKKILRGESEIKVHFLTGKHYEEITLFVGGYFQEKKDKVIIGEKLFTDYIGVRCKLIIEAKKRDLNRCISEERSDIICELIEEIAYCAEIEKTTRLRKNLETLRTLTRYEQTA